MLFVTVSWLLAYSSISGQQYQPTGLGLALVAVPSDFSPYCLYTNLLNMLVQSHHF
jgi:hypothetical protein